MIAGSTQFGRLLPPYWSLDVEMLFYLIAPFLVMLTSRLLAGTLTDNREKGSGSVRSPTGREVDPMKNTPHHLFRSRTVVMLITIAGLTLWSLRCFSSGQP
ncbi:MAG: hypothetical protein NTW52_07945 [Planctomycetota bacterium]|nr:hypothetical protein [Planctomycetota bacterium]